MLAVAWQVYDRPTDEPSLRVAGWKQLHPGESDIEFVLTVPRSPNLVYVGGFLGGNPFKSTDGGASWSRVGDAPEDSFERAMLEALAFGFGNAVVDPTAPQTLYGADASRDVFKSTNGGASWARVWRSPRGTDVMALAIDPRRPSILYAGTSSHDRVLDDAGVLKSTDRGRSWRRTPLRASSIGFERRLAIAIDPRKPRTLYVTGGEFFYRSTDGGQSWTKLILRAAGLDPSALPLSPSTSSFGPITSLAIDPSRADTVYVAASDDRGFQNGQETFVLKSTNGGESWAVVARLKGRCT